MECVFHSLLNKILSFSFRIMEVKNLISENRDKLLERILSLHNKTKIDLTKDITIIKDWLNTQQHLPEIPSIYLKWRFTLNLKSFKINNCYVITGDNVITNFLTINKFSIELAKQKLDMYYSIRSLIPEIFHNKHPRLPFMKETAETV